MPTTSNLRFVDKQLVKVGDGPIDMVVTIKIAEAILSLPPTAETPKLSIAGVLRDMSPGTKRSFETLTTLDNSLRDIYATYKNAFVAIAKPDMKVPAWRIKLEDVIEEVFVDCAPVMSIVFTTDGERFISSSVGDYSALLTFEEFEHKYGRDVREHVYYAANVKIKSLHRTLQLLDQNKPIEMTLSVCTSNLEMFTKSIKVYHLDQVQLFACRHDLSIMHTITTSEGQPND